MHRKENLNPKTKLKSWHCCESCGDQIFPNADKTQWSGITLMEGKCPYCGKVKTLIPYDDWGGFGD